MSFSISKVNCGIKHTVEFDVNGGESISYASATYSLGSTYKSFPTALKSGYILQGWYTDPENGSKIEKSSEVDFRITKLYAHYIAFSNYTSFNVTTTSSYKEFGFYSLTKKSDSESVYIDWGDGNQEEITSYSQVYHTYSSVGSFVVKVSDDITQFCMSNSSSTYYNKVRYTFRSIAAWSTGLATSLPSYCFYYCSAMNSLQNLTSVTSIGTYCFYYCSSLTSFTGLGNITFLPTYSFGYCSGITSLSTLPTSVTLYDQYCLRNSGVSDLSRVRSTDTLNTFCFAYMNSLTSLDTLPPRSSLPSYCFNYCTSLKKANLSSWTSLKTLPSYCFNNTTYLTSFIAPSSLTSMSDSCFYYSGRYAKLTADFSDSQLTSLPAYSFYYSNYLSEIKLPDTVKSIGNYAFYYCYNYLTSICLPSALTSIGSYAFYYCKALQHISCLAENAPTVQSNTFGNSTTYYTGRNTYSAGTNTLYVNNPNNYNTSYWSSVLLDSSKCGYHAESLNPYDLTYGKMVGLSSWYLSTGSEIVPDISVYASNGTMLTEDVGYDKVLSNNVEVGTAQISAVGISPYYGSLSSTFKILSAAPTYTELEYIQGNGAVFNTGYTPTTNTSFEVKMTFDNYTGDVLIGHWGSDATTQYNSQDFRLFNADSSTNIFWDCGNYRKNVNISFTPSDFHIVKCYNGGFTFDGTTYSSYTTSTNVSVGNIKIFGAYDSYTSGCNNKISYLKIYESDVLKMHLVSYQDGNGIPCLCDILSGKFYYSTNDKIPIAGPEK